MKKLNLTNTFLMLFLIATAGMLQAQCRTVLYTNIEQSEITVYPNDFLDSNNDYSNLQISLDGINFQEDLTFDCDNLGDYTIVVNGNANGAPFSCTTELNVSDSIAPLAIAISSFDITLASDSDSYTLSVDDINEGSYDNCMITSMYLSQTEFNIDDLGQTPVAFTVSDGVNNQSSAFSIVNVYLAGQSNELICLPNVNIATSIFGGPSTIQAEAFVEGASQYDLIEISLDNGNSYSTSHNFDCDDVDLGTQAVLVRGFIGNEIYTCSTTCTVLDQTSPVAIAESEIILVLDPNGEAALTVEMVNEGSYDNCSDVTMTLSQYDFTTNDLGENTVVMTVTDASGNEAFVWTTVIVTDGVTCIFPNDITWPDNINIYDDNATSDQVTPDDLVSLYGYTEAEVEPQLPDYCMDIAFTYSDQIFLEADGVRILRTWIAVDWNSANTATHHQTINLYNANTSVLVCINGLVVDISQGPVTLYPMDFLISFSGNPNNLGLVIRDSSGDIILGNLITPNYNNELLTYEVTYEGNSCWGHVTAEGASTYCELDIDNDVSWPLSNIEITDPTVDAVDLTPELLESNYGFPHENVNVVFFNTCNLAAVNYEDVVTQFGNGFFQIVRTFTVIDWLTFAPASNTGLWTFTQIIRNGIDPDSLICDTLDRTTPVGDCASGHTHDDDVEWPADIHIADYRITPNELIMYSGINALDSEPFFDDMNLQYSVNYSDLLLSISPSEVHVGRVWVVTHTFYNISWTYTQNIYIDITDFDELVTVSTSGGRAMPEVSINDIYMTNEQGMANVPDAEIENIEYNDAPRNGVNIYDLYLAQKAVLGTRPFNDQQLIAADIDENNIFNLADLNEIKSIIMNTAEHNWRFIDQTASLQAGFSPRAHYLAYKKGDIDDSALLAGEFIDWEEELEMTINDELLNNGENYQVPLYLNEVQSALGIEIHLKVFPTEYIQINDITSDNFEGSIDWHLEEENLTIIMFTENGARTIGGNQSPLVHIEFSALENTLIHHIIQNDNSYAHLITANEQLLNIPYVLKNEITGTHQLEEGILKIYPNPTSDFIVIDHEAISNKALFTLMDVNGRILIKQEVKKQIDITNIPEGSYIYQIVDNTGKWAGKISVIK